MKQPIIIFTRPDTATNQYFLNLFSDFNSELQHWIFDKSEEYIIFFIKDNTTNDIDAINILWHEYTNSVPWIFFHKQHNVMEQYDWIEKNFNDFQIYISGSENLANAGDHHNQDGKYFSYLVSASNCFKQGKNSEMNNHFKAIGELLNN